MIICKILTHLSVKRHIIQEGQSVFKGSAAGVSGKGE